MYAQRHAPIVIAGRYEIIDLIASGGMAAVYRSWDYMTDRYVAVKALRLTDDPDADPFGVERFRREAQAAARISHPNVVMIYDFIEASGGPFLIMEYIDGVNLKRSIARHGALPAVRALYIAEQICSALAAAHTLGMIHRDIKPQNILLTTDGRARLTDFGIVRLAGSDALTRSGIVLGTADYLSPEQACGEKLSPASDLYSLGVVLYEMLTGVPPFTGANPISVAMRHANEPVPSPAALNPAVPPSVEAVWRPSVAKEPRRRYRSAAQMARALHRCRLDLIHSSLPPEDAAQLTPFAGPPAAAPRRHALLRWLPVRHPR